MATEAQNLSSLSNELVPGVCLLAFLPGIRGRNTKYDIRYKYTKDYVRNYKRIMQNKANFRKSQMNVSIYLQTAYENKSNWTLGENKPNSNPVLSAVEWANQTQFLQMPK